MKLSPLMVGDILALAWITQTKVKRRKTISDWLENIRSRFWLRPKYPRFKAEVLAGTEVRKSGNHLRYI